MTFNHAMRWEFFDRNPITLVRQSAKRVRVPDVLTVARNRCAARRAQRPVLRGGTVSRDDGTSGFGAPRPAMVGRSLRQRRDLSMSRHHESSCR